MSKQSDVETLVPFQCSSCGHYMLTTLESGSVKCVWCEKEYMIK